MSVFGDYARYYNLLYQDKPYTQEVDFVLSCLAHYGCIPKTLLDMGCGTGRHALEMAQRGIAVTGVDMSETMLEMGNEALANCIDLDKKLLPTLHHGDARTVRLHQRFDAVVSLFHVMSYQTTEEDVLALFATAKEHLQDNALFLFDFWYGAGVLTDPPIVRQRTLENTHTIVERKATPVHTVPDNTIDVHYHITLTDKARGKQSQLHEVHTIRYWFLPELRYLARQAGLRVMGDGAWMTDHTVNVDTWNGWMTVGI